MNPTTVNSAAAAPGRRRRVGAFGINGIDFQGAGDQTLIGMSRRHPG